MTHDKNPMIEFRSGVYPHANCVQRQLHAYTADAAVCSCRLVVSI